MLPEKTPSKLPLEKALKKQKKNPEKINPLKNAQNKKVILHYCSSFTVVFGIPEGIRKAAQ